MARRALVALIVLTISSLAHAHPEGFSGLRIDVQNDRVHAVVTVHTRDTSAWFPPAKYPDYVPQVCAAMAAAPSDVLDIQFDGKPASPGNVRAFATDVGLIEFGADYFIPPGASAMQVWSRHLIRLPRGHQQIVVIEHAGATLLEETLTSDQDSTEVELPKSSSASTQAAEAKPKRISFFLLGVEHIVTGYDHLLFLVALLLVCKNFRQAAGVITFFTIAHSITLSLAALNIVNLPARIVEPAIAASIVYVGLENIFGRHRFIWRAAITFAFGLVHGLGFASALREVGLGSTSVGVAMPLLKFSIGLETGQLCIAAVMLRIMLSLRKRPDFERRWMPAGSILVAAIGMYWLVTRIAFG